MNSLHEALLSDVGDPSFSVPQINQHNIEIKSAKDAHYHSAASTSNTTTAGFHSSEERIVSFVFWLIGVGTLLPWNAFTSAAPYFQSRLCHSSQAFIRDNFEAIFGFIMTFSAVLSLAIMVLFQMKAKIQSHHLLEDAHDKARDSFQDERRKRFWNLVPLLLYTITFIFAMIYIFLPFLSPDTFFYLTITGLFICGASGSIAGATFVSLASMFPTHMALNPYFSGQGLGAVLLVTVNFALSVSDNEVGVRNFYKEHCYDEDETNHDGNTTSTALWTNKNTIFASENTVEPDSEYMERCPEYTINMEAFFYFSVAIVVLMACIIGYLVLERLAITQFYKESAQYSHQNDDDLDDDEDCDQDSNALFHSLHLLEMETDPELHDFIEEGNSPHTKSSPPFARLQIDSSNESIHDLGTSELSKVWKMLSIPSLSLFVTLLVTLAMFPAWDNKLSSIHQCSGNKRIFNDLFFPLTFIVYYFFDLVGRIMAGYMNSYTQPEALEILSRKLFIWSMVRLIFIPLFLLCPANDSIVPKLQFFQSDLVTFVILALFALSNGILITMCFSVSSDIVGPSMDYKEKSSMIMNLSMNVGLLMGSFLSFGVLKVGTGLW